MLAYKLTLSPYKRILCVTSVRRKFVSKRNGEDYVRSSSHNTGQQKYRDMVIPFLLDSRIGHLLFSDPVDTGSRKRQAALHDGIIYFLYFHFAASSVSSDLLGWARVPIDPDCRAYGIFPHGPLVVSDDDRSSEAPGCAQVFDVMDACTSDPGISGI